ncbi:MAG: hypothetical protein NZ551_10320 [Microscillaceae bacterium]|nr:hypothetical protein [Microscillaceae bacterium]MDW8461592.1 hypothetical protein [Cytophagales bacterium]
MLQEHQATFLKTSPFYTFGQFTEKTTHVWWLFHGYGQLGQYFYKKFEVLSPEHHFLIIPEGTSKFYYEGFTGKIGASWLTKYQREQEIADALRYLREVKRQVPLPADATYKTTLLGFSQGASMASRWALSEEIDFNRLILWAGNFPHDANKAHVKNVFQGKEIIFVYGTQDEFIERGLVQLEKSYFDKLGISLQVITFEGKHELVSEIIESLSKSL